MGDQGNPWEFEEWLEAILQLATFAVAKHPEAHTILTNLQTHLEI